MAQPEKVSNGMPADLEFEALAGSRQAAGTPRRSSGYSVERANIALTRILASAPYAPFVHRPLVHI